MKKNEKQDQKKEYRKTIGHRRLTDRHNFFLFHRKNESKGSTLFFLFFLLLRSIKYNHKKFWKDSISFFGISRRFSFQFEKFAIRSVFLSQTKFNSNVKSFLTMNFFVTVVLVSRQTKTFHFLLIHFVILKQIPYDWRTIFDANYKLSFSCLINIEGAIIPLILRDSFKIVSNSRWHLMT